LVIGPYSLSLDGEFLIFFGQNELDN